MKKLLLIITLVCLNANAQKIDAGSLLSGSDLSYVDAAEKEIEVYLKSKCHQLNAAKRTMILEYKLLNYTEEGGSVKRNVVGLKKVLGWNAVLKLKYGCNEKDFYDFTQFFNIRSNVKQKPQNNKSQN